MTAPFQITSLPFDGCKIEHGGKTILLNNVEQAQLLDVLLDSKNGLAFDMNIEHPNQIAVMTCDNGRYNIALRSVDKSKRMALLGLSAEAMSALSKSIAEAIASSPSPRQQ